MENTQKENETYSIVDNNGTIYAHDITSYAKAELIIADMINSGDYTRNEIEELGIEII